MRGGSEEGAGPGGGDGGHAAPKSCPRKGTKVTTPSWKKRKVQLNARKNIEDDSAHISQLHSTTHSTRSTRSNAKSNASKTFTYNPIPAAPPIDVQQQTTLHLLHLMSPEDHLSWTEDFGKAIRGEPWAHPEALAVNSLENLAERCERAQGADKFSVFCRMMNDLMFAAKVNRWAG